MRIQSRKKTLHICPPRPSWQLLLRINSRPLNGFSQMPRTPSLLGTVTEKCPQGGYNVANGDASPSSATPKSEIGINIVGMNARERPSDWTIPTKKLSDCAAKIINAVVGKCALLLRPVAVFIQSRSERNLLTWFAKIAEIPKPGTSVSHESLACRQQVEIGATGVLIIVAIDNKRSHLVDRDLQIGAQV